jgi:membrane associated rhomboid family serine protease
MISVLAHANAVHLISNLAGLAALAPRVARRVGVLHALLLAAAAGEFSNRAAAELLGRPVIGASAAVFALAGAWLVLFAHDRRARAGIWLLVTLQAAFATISLDFGGVAWVAHVAGVALGAVWAVCARPLGPQGRREPRR